MLNMAMGHVLRALDNSRQAVEAYEQALRRGGDEYRDAYMYIGFIYYKQLDNEKSLKYLKKYKKKGGDNPKVDGLIEELSK
jgi:tetratricopeptide (TPR) repeat protein